MQVQNEARLTVDTDEYNYSEVVVVGWLLGNPSKAFSINYLAQELDVSIYMVSKVLSNEQVTELYKIEDADHTKKYASLAPELMPSVEGLLELFTQESMDMDELGRQARAEFWYRAHDEFQNIRKHKVVQRF